MRSPGDESGPAEIIRRWVVAWSALDADAVSSLFVPGASYVSGRDGELDQLPRRFRIAARTWRSLEIGDVSIDEPLTDADLSVVAGRYRFRGVDRRGERLAYSAAFTFVLRRADGGPWRIHRLQESLLPPGVPSG